MKVVSIAPSLGSCQVFSGSSVLKENQLDTPQKNIFFPLQSSVITSHFPQLSRLFLSVAESKMIESSENDLTIRKLYNPFEAKRYMGIHAQFRRNILTACKDLITTLAHQYAGQKWFLPQTELMWLEDKRLSKPEICQDSC